MKTEIFAIHEEGTDPFDSAEEMSCCYSLMSLLY